MFIRIVSRDVSRSIDHGLCDKQHYIRLLPSRSMGQLDINRTVIISFYIRTSVVVCPMNFGSASILLTMIGVGFLSPTQVWAMGFCTS